MNLKISLLEIRKIIVCLSGLILQIFLSNGITGAKKTTKYGRRSFTGNGIFASEFNDDKYHETSDANFKKCVKKYSGYYLSVYRARYDSDGNVSYSGEGTMVDCIQATDAKNCQKIHEKIS